MADSELQSAGPANGKLPSLSPTAKTSGPKPVKRKKKKPATETANATANEESPRRRKTKSKTAGEEAEHDDQELEEAPTPRKKKKRKPVNKQDQDGEPSSARSTDAQGEDVEGSKSSLISKSKDGTPRKKGKKKVKKATPRKDDEFLDSTILGELVGMEEDVVATKTSQEQEPSKSSYKTASAVLQSQPTDKMFIETERGFRGENKTRFAKRVAEEQEEKKAAYVTPSRSTTLEMALTTHKVLRTFLLFIHGLTAGIAMWHIVIAFVLLYQPYVDFLVHYQPLAMPVQCMFYILLVLCTVSACDRFDIGKPNRRFVLRAITMQSGAVSILVYFVAIILSLSIISVEDRMNLYYKKPELWNDTTVMESEIILWRNINTARGAAVILGWFILSITPNADRLTRNLKQADDNILGKAVVELQGVAPA